MDVAAAHAVAGEVAVQLFGHPLGKGGHQNAFVLFGPLSDLFHQVVHLVLGGAYLDGRVQQAGGADNLFYHQALGLLQFVIGRGGAHVDGLAGDGFKLVKGEGAVVAGGGEAEAVLYQGFLAGVVSAVHSADLGEGYVALVYEYQEIVREIINEGEGPLAGFSAVKIAGVVLYAGAVAHLLDHFYVVFHALLEALGFQELANGLKVFHLFDQVVLDLAHGLGSLFLGSDKVLGGVEVNLVHLLKDGSAHRINKCNAVYLVSKELDAGCVVGSTQEDVHGVSAHAETASLKICFGPVVKRIHDFVQQTGHRHLFALPNCNRLVVKVVRVANSVEAAHGGDHYDVSSAAHKGRSGTHAQFVYLIVDAEVLFYIGIGGGDVGLRLVVIVVRNKVLYGIVRKECFKFSIQLGGQRFVVTQDERRTLQTLDYVGHRKGFSGTRNAQKCHIMNALAQCVTQCVNGFGLVAGRLIIGLEPEIHL